VTISYFREIDSAGRAQEGLPSGWEEARKGTSILVDAVTPKDGYTAEHMEIAAYQLLERLADRADDTETAEIARRNRSDEEEMAKRIDRSWDRTLDLTLEENGIRV